MKSTANIAGLVLIDSVGVRFNTRETPDFADLYGLTQAELNSVCITIRKWRRSTTPAHPKPELEIIARNREAEARFCWSPYLHNPRLNARLYRATVPTLVLWGESDTFAPVAYGQKLAKALPHASFETISKAGHFPHIEQPNELVSRIERFAATLRKATAGPQMEVAR